MTALSSFCVSLSSKKETFPQYFSTALLTPEAMKEGAIFEHLMKAYS